MKTRLVLIGSALVLLLFSVSAAFAAPIKVGDVVSFSRGAGKPLDNKFWEGGEYLTYKWGWDGKIKAFVFGTFCVERSETLELGDTKKYTVDSISDYVVKGGTDNPAGRKLTDQEAWLFTQYYMGISTNNKPLEYAAIQEAIWHYGLPKYSLTRAGSLTTTWIARAEAAIEDGWRNNGRVKAVNIVDASKVHRQSTLIYVPEPATMFLLGLGIVGLGVFRRRRSPR